MLILLKKNTLHSGHKYRFVADRVLVILWWSLSLFVNNASVSCNGSPMGNVAGFRRNGYTAFHQPCLSSPGKLGFCQRAM